MFGLTHIGICLTEKKNAVATATKKSKTVKVLKSTEAPPTPVAEPQNPDAIRATLAKDVQELVQAIGQKPKSVVVKYCVPARRFYAASFPLPKARGKRLEQLIEQECASQVPEYVSSLTKKHTVYSKQNSTLYIAVHAVPSVLVDTLTQTGVAISGITTLPIAVAQSVSALQKGTAILVAKTSTESTVSLFHKGILLDEEVFGPETDAAALQKSAESLQAEYIDQFPVIAYYTVGNTGVSSVGDVPVIAVLPEYSSLDLSTCAALAAITEPALSLTHSNLRGAGKVLLSIAILAGFSFGVYQLWQWYRGNIVTEQVIDDIAPEQENTFTDIFAGDTDTQAMYWAAEQGILIEEGSSVFGPELPVTRAEFLLATVTLGAEEDVSTITAASGYTDVADYPEITFALRYAKREGFISGTEFDPGAIITLPAALKLAYEALNIDIETTDADPWFEPYLVHAEENSVLPSGITVKSELTREDAAWMLWKLWNYKEAATDL